jgi:hypothetical protein
VGVGQLTAGTSRRSPEIFIPLIARDYAPEFWGWPILFHEDTAHPGKMDRRGVRMLVDNSVIEVNMMTWPAKRDFRLRSEHLRSAGSVGDIIALHLGAPGAGYEYEAYVVKQSDAQFATYLGLCSNPVRNSLKTWGYF